MTDLVEALARVIGGVVCRGPIEPRGEWTRAARAALSELDRLGYAVVPKEPTEAMVSAAQCALKVYVDALPAAERDKLGPRNPGDYIGYRVPASLKYRLRWSAMLAASPRVGE